MNEDTRNLVDNFKGVTEAEIIAQLDQSGVQLEIAIENLERDFNMGSIVRSANAFGVRMVHVIGRRQWNKRGAMATDRYMHITYHATVDEFVAFAHQRNKRIIAVDNVPSAQSIHSTDLPESSILVFGSEGRGISDALLSVCETCVEIRQSGSTRSLNVAAAAAIAMYEWSCQRYY